MNIQKTSHSPAESSTSLVIQMMAKQYNMCHVFLKDISLFSLAEFLKVKHRKLNNELVKVVNNFIEYL